MGDTKRPLYFLIIACLTNIVLDVLFVMGFGMGVLALPPQPSSPRWLPVCW